MSGPLRGICVDPVTGAYADPVADPLLAAVLAAVVDLFESVPNADVPCSWLIVGGDQVQVDRGGYVGTTPGGAACAGLLTVRLVSLTPADQFPNNGGGPIRQFALSWAARVEVGVWRPSAEPTETGDGLVLPAVEEEQAVGEQTRLDAAIVRAAVLGWAEESDVPIVFDSYTPWGPMGGVIGGATLVQLQIL